MHQRHFQAEGGRLGVDAVAAADHRRELVFARLAGDDFAQGLDIGNENVRRLRHLHGEGGVDDIAAGQAEMQPAAGGRADVFGDVGGEGDDVVIEGLLQFLAAFDAEGGLGLHLGEIRRRERCPRRPAPRLASNSICSQISSLRCSVQISRISARE